MYNIASILSTVFLTPVYLILDCWLVHLLHFIQLFCKCASDVNKSCCEFACDSESQHRFLWHQGTFLPPSDRNCLPTPGSSRWGTENIKSNYILSNDNTRRNTYCAVSAYQQWQLDRHDDNTPIEHLDRETLAQRLEVYFQQVCSITMHPMCHSKTILKMIILYIYF
jgi:hypothetical protein